MSFIDQLVNNVIRPDIRPLTAYPVADSAGLLKLDAMENPYPLPQHLRAELAQRLSEVAMNRYPTPSYTALKAKIRATLGVPAGYDVILGNGSDELISMISTACAKSGACAMAPVPAFVMYAISAQFAGLEFIGVPLLPDMTLDLPAMLAGIARHRPALVYLAYPNNPTGTLFDAADIVQIIGAVGDAGVVVVDEAYQPFAQTSFMPRLAEFDNLLVMRTVSKLGLAGIRLGYMSANPVLLREFEKVRPPYNINILTQTAAEFVLDHVAVLDAQAAALRAERARLANALLALPGVEVFPSAANFLLIRVHNAEQVFAKLLERKILIKNVGKMHKLLANCLRVTVSTAEENNCFLDALRASLIL